jgi:hypothetical protein
LLLFDLQLLLLLACLLVLPSSFWLVCTEHLVYLLIILRGIGALM